MSNAIVSHIDKSGHLPDFSKAKVLASGLGKSRRKLVETAYIANTKNFNTKANRESWARIPIDLIFHEVRRLTPLGGEKAEAGNSVGR